MALVTLPAASRRSVTARTLSGCRLISTMPPALSAMGPKLFIARMKAAEESMPMVATAVPSRPALWPPPMPEVRPSHWEGEGRVGRRVSTSEHTYVSRGCAATHVCSDDCDADDERGPHRGLHAPGEAGDDVGGVAGDGGVRDVLHRVVGVVGEVLGGEDEGVGGEHAHDAAAEKVQPRPGRGRRVQQPPGAEQEPDCGEDA